MLVCERGVAISFPTNLISAMGCSETTPNCREEDRARFTGKALHRYSGDPVPESSPPHQQDAPPTQIAGYALIITMFTLPALLQPGLQTPCSIGFLNSNAFFVLRIPNCVGSTWRSNVVRSPANIASADSMPASVAMSRSVRLT
jgi:hypothetical protein